MRSSKPKSEEMQAMIERYRSEEDVPQTSLNALGFSNLDCPSERQLKSAYRSLALLSHPDKADEKEAQLCHRLFIKVQDAYNDLLENPPTGDFCIPKTATQKRATNAIAESWEALHARNEKFKDDLREARAEALRWKQEHEEIKEEKKRQLAAYEAEVAAKEAERREDLKTLVVEVDKAKEAAKASKSNAKEGTRKAKLVNKRIQAQEVREEHKKVWTKDHQAYLKTQRQVAQLEEQEAEVNKSLAEIQDQLKYQWSKALMSGAPNRRQDCPQSVSLVEKTRRENGEAMKEMVREVQVEDEHNRILEVEYRRARMQAGATTECWTEREDIAEKVEEKVQRWVETLPPIGCDEISDEEVDDIENDQAAPFIDAWGSEHPWAIDVQ